MGRQTISFVATDELADWLDEEATRRMTTVSSAAQQLLVEKYREQRDDGAEASKDVSAGGEDVDEFLREHEDVWYVPDSEKHSYAVTDPKDRRRYYKTKEGVANAIRRWHLD